MMATFSLWLLLAYVLTYQASALQYDSDIFVAFDDGQGSRPVRSVDTADHLGAVERHLLERQIFRDTCRLFPGLCKLPGPKSALPGTNKADTDSFAGVFYPGGPYVGAGSGGSAEGAQFVPSGRSGDGLLPGTYSDGQQVNSGMIYPGGPYIGGGGSSSNEGANFYPRSVYDYYPFSGPARSVRHEKSGQSANVNVKVSTSATGKGRSSAHGTAASRADKAAHSRHSYDAAV